MHKRILIGCLLCCALVPAQEDPLNPRELVYLARLGETEIGRETTRFSGDGWSTEGRFDILGTRKGKFAASFRPKAGGFDYELTLDLPARKLTLPCDFVPGLFTVRVAGTEKKKEVKLDDGVVPIPYDDLVWAVFIGIGRDLARREAAGGLETGAKISLVTGAGGAEFAIEHVESETVSQTVKGRSVPLRVSRVRFPGPLDMLIVATPAGLPLRIDVPAQKITVRAQGFGDIRSKEKTPTSIVDSGPWRERLSKPEHEVAVSRKVMIPLRDGVSLAADIYRPEGEGPFPTILSRTPYGRETQAALEGTRFARRGYVYVAQDVRGRGDSEGHWFPFINETIDGSDTLDWVAAQPWSNGDVGMIGASYVGLVQWLAAKSGNPHLKCIVPQVSPPDPHENFPYEGGLFLCGAAWWARVLESMKHETAWQSGLDWVEAFQTLPLGDLDRAMKLKERTFLDTWVQHPPHDRSFWAHATYQHLFSEFDLPAFHVSGWYDGDMPGAIMNFEGMKKHAPSARARNGQFLVMGPWTHIFNSARRMGDVDFGDEGVVDLDARILRFFDRYLKGVDNGIEKEPPVHVFTMGTNRWHGEASWPLPQTKFRKLFLRSYGDAHRRFGGGRLAESPADGGLASSSYRYDPADLPQLDIDFTDISGAQATEDLRYQPDRVDELEFTAKLETACEIVGPVSVVLYVETDAADTDFAVSLLRTSADGRRRAIRGGVQRLRYAKSPVEDHPVKPGTITKVTVDCWATGFRFDAGDVIELVVSSWAWPGYCRGTNTLDPPLTATRTVVATNVIHHSKEHPSHVLLPVVPRDDAPGLKLKRF